MITKCLGRDKKYLRTPGLTNCIWLYCVRKPASIDPTHAFV